MQILFRNYDNNRSIKQKVSVAIPVANKLLLQDKDNINKKGYIKLNKRT